MIGTGIVDLSGHVYVISFEYLSTERLDRNEKAFHECLIVESGQDWIYRNELRVKTFTEREDMHWKFSFHQIYVKDSRAIPGDISREYVTQCF